MANPAVDGRDAYIILDATSGRELSSDQPDQLRHPASLTKLMTIYLTFSALDSGRLSLGDGLPVSINALNAPPTKMGLPPGGTVSVRDATMALVTRSANDAAVVLAEALGGDEATFAQMMTSKARQLGMSQTVFRNASGLPNREQVTTARDMARLAFALMRDFPHYYPVFSVQSWPYRGRSLENHNRMLGSYEGADGLKTGYTNASGFNLVMSAMRDNRRLIGVVMGGDSAGQRDRMMAMLMDQGFATAATMRLSAWTNIRKPPSARYTSANFDPSLIIPESTPRLATASAAAAGRLHGRRAAAGARSRRPSSASPAWRRRPPAEGSAAPQAARRSAAGSSRSARSAIRRPPSSRSSGPSSTLSDMRVGHRGRRRGADGQQDLPPRAAHQPLPGAGRRRLQAAGEEEDLLLGDPGHRLEYAGSALKRLPDAGDEGPLVAALPQREIPRRRRPAGSSPPSARTPTPSSACRRSSP